MRRLLILVLALVALLVAVPVASAQGGGGVVVAGETVIQSGQLHRGDMVVFGGKLTVRQGGTITGNLTVFGGNADVAGTIQGDVVLLGGTAQLRDTAVIQGNLTTIGGTVERAPGATVRGQVTTPGGSVIPPIAPPIPGLPGVVPNVPGVPGAPASPAPFQAQPRNPVLSFLGWLARTVLITLGLALLGVLAMLLLPRPLRNVADTMRVNTAASIGMGALTWVVWLIALPLVALLSALLVIVFCIGLLGIPVLLALAIGLPVALLLGWLATGLLLGDAILRAFGVRDDAPLVAAGLGTLLLTGAALVIGQIPCFGSVFNWLLSLPGLGAVVLTWFGTRAWRPGDPYLPSRRGYTPTPPPAPSDTLSAPLPPQVYTPPTGPASSYAPPASYAPPDAATRYPASAAWAGPMASSLTDREPAVGEAAPPPAPSSFEMPAPPASVAPQPPEPQPLPPAPGPTAMTPPVYSGASIPMDDLTSIPGVTPGMAAVLKARGVGTYAQLSYMTPDEVRDILAESDVPPVTEDEARAMIRAADHLVRGGD